MDVVVKPVVWDGAPVTISIEPGFAEIDGSNYLPDLNTEDLLRGSQMPRKYIGHAVGDGLGKGAWGMLRKRFLMISHMVVSDTVFSLPSTIESHLPNVDCMVVIPQIAYQIVPNEEGLIAEKRRIREIELMAEQEARRVSFLAEDFGVFGPSLLISASSVVSSTKRIVRDRTFYRPRNPSDGRI